MEKKYNPTEYNNAIACEVCGGLNYADDYGNSAKCPHCGWEQSKDSEIYEEMYGISYPMLVSLSHAREQYKAGKPFKANFEDFIEGILRLLYRGALPLFCYSPSRKTREGEA